MTIGAQFLARINEAKEVKSFSFDRGVEAMKKAMRAIGGESDFADKIAEVAAMSGIAGQYLNKPDVRESVVDAAMSLRSKPARVRSFLALHSALSAFHGMSSAAVAEAKSEDDLEGTGFQQLVEEVLIVLGIPAELVSGDAKAGVKAGLKRMTAKLRSDSAVRMAFVNLAKYSGVKIKDGVAGEKKVGMKVAESQLDEAEMGKMNPVDSAMKILGLLGVNLTDEKIVRVVNQAMLNRNVRLATRNSKVRAAMVAFLQKAE